MILLTLTDVSFSHGGPSLLDGVSLQVDEGERLGLLGRNASGKTTLMSVMMGELELEAGVVSRRQGLTVARLPQEVPAGMRGTVGGMVGADVPAGEEAWRTKERLARLFEGLRLDPAADVAALSAGLARRALLARALAAAPDVLLLDEPTNHLDVESIEWLEAHLLERKGATLFVTHDRAFLRRLATRILELDRGKLTSWPGDYANYLRRQEERAEDEAQRHARADRRLAREEVWALKGVKAQRNRNYARVAELERLRQERRERREATGSVRVSIADAEKSGQLVLEAKGLTAGYGRTPVVRGLDLVVTRGDRLGLVGPNGSGKTTLVRTLLGDVPPLAGTVRRGTKLEPIWFDPLNASFDPEATLEESVIEGSTVVAVDGRTRHVTSYLADFLFEPDRARQRVKVLSGGERSRLLLARLFARPSNLMVLDEPTNDLDAETMDVLEDALLAYPGTVLVVSHDRDFLDQVVTGLVVFEGKGIVREVVGGWSAWDRLRAAEAASPRPAAAPAPKPAADHRAAVRDRREIERLEKKIDALEAEKKTLHAAMEDPAFWTGPKDRRDAVQARVAEVDREVAAAFERWGELQR
ncbi:MAG: ATP-binding cassette domain-containing protein [Planctomycetes bacterium]|nr:ATP-binding cassette domain-containing protein [Planctomycetota bacterium]